MTAKNYSKAIIPTAILALGILASAAPANAAIIGWQGTYTVVGDVIGFSQWGPAVINPPLPGADVMHVTAHVALSCDGSITLESMEWTGSNTGRRDQNGAAWVVATGGFYLGSAGFSTDLVSLASARSIEVGVGTVSMTLSGNSLAGGIHYEFVGTGFGHATGQAVAC